ncbi:Choline dehydrogenase [Arthrobacter sp. ok909]|uniref:GMC family oxidoreductase n=1 Tax=Arthrobacter sp. ok909 TaxID=1761746 RepID=UPI000890B3DD|nr:GMC family oxidoreductase [Arthrobacter sp. ok909]SDP42819.1 Choline dehydrogenase [Arthrobacter sp. ok909]
MTHSGKPESVDVLIVGLGAAGGTAAKVLSEAGLKVVGLERGPWLKPHNFSGDELKFLNRPYLWSDARLNPRTVRMDENSQAEEIPFSMTPQMVGGGTVHWAGWFPRPSESDFLMRSLHGDLEGASLADWPIRYEHLEPYLSKVEWEFGCTGLDGANKYEPPRSTRYPSPPLPPTRYGKKFYQACEKLGINAMPIPQAMVTTPHKGRDPWNWTSFWNGYGDPSTTKSTTLTSFIPEAMATGNFELRAECYVREVTVHPNGRAKGVVYIDSEGREVEQEAKLVILTLGAIESARLMLMSKSSLFPEGIANGSGQVGRNATFHEYLFSTGLFDSDEPLYGFAGNYISGGSFEFYETDENRGHIGGALIGASHMCHAINWEFPSRPTWGSAAKDADLKYYNHAMKIGHTLHDMPVESNRVDLDPDVKDAWGLPAARITHKSHPNDLKLAKWQVDKNAEILMAAGARKTFPTYMEAGRSTGNTCHQHGTARMGTDPSTTVLNEWCQAHDVNNLFVLDGSSFPTATGVNPTLTIMANAWRCAEYIAEVYAKGGEGHITLEPLRSDPRKKRSAL